jgi:hypothetical protein
MTRLARALLELAAVTAFVVWMCLLADILSTLWPNG